MAEHLTEEEQIERIKRWWADNGRSVVIGVVLAVVGYFGWEGWQSQQQQSRETASVLYEDLSTMMSNAGPEGLSEEQLLEAASLAEELQSDHGGLLYASDAAMLIASAAVQQGDLARAEEQLRWALEQNHSEALNLLARERLARVLAAQQQYDEALQVLDVEDEGAYAAIFSEQRGDVLLAQGNTSDAQLAYQAALQALLPGQSNRSNILQMKLDDVQASLATQSTEAAPAEGQQ